MMKVYSTKEVERDLLAFLAEFRCRVLLNYPIKGVTKKMRKKASSYKVVNFPIA